MSKHARRTDPETSHAAAAEVDASTLATHKTRVLTAIRHTTTGGMTWKEAEQATGVLNCWRRVSDLLDDEVIVPTGDTRYHAETGRSERVYVAVEFSPGYERVQLTLEDA